MRLHVHTILDLTLHSIWQHSSFERFLSRLTTHTKPWSHAHYKPRSAAWSTHNFYKVRWTQVFVLTCDSNTTIVKVMLAALGAIGDGLLDSMVCTFFLAPQGVFTQWCNKMPAGSCDRKGSTIATHTHACMNILKAIRPRTQSLMPLWGFYCIAWSKMAQPCMWKVHCCM